MIKASKVLLVDDEQELLENLSFDLRDTVEELFFATNGRDALEIYQEYQSEISCIITDIKMPKMNGLQFISKIRELSQTVPVIFLTAHGDQEQMKLALSLNAFDFISKPYDLWELKEALHSIYNTPLDSVKAS